MSTIQTSSINAELEIRDSNGDLTPIQAGALRGTAVAVAPIFQDSAGTQIGTIARAWVYFNAATGTPVILSSFNVSSITDGGVGTFTVNFATPMPDANYAAISTADSGGSVSPRTSQSESQTANGVSFTTRTFQNGVASGALQDMTNIKLVVFD